MTPAIGRIVHYTLTGEDARQIAARRSFVVFPGGGEDEPRRTWFDGNGVGAGQVFPAMVVSVSGGEVNLQVSLDGNDAYWAADVQEGDGPGRWAWPQREPSGV